MSSPVSIIIAARNAARTLRETLESVLAQTRPEWEVIVVDDGSSDETVALVAEFAARDSRFRLLCRPALGVSAARNTGLDAARYEWLLFVDGDDVMLPTQLERLTARLQDHPDLDAVHCGWARLAPDGTIIPHESVPTAPDLFTEFTSHCAFVIHACLVRKSCVDLAGRFDTTLQTCEDFDLWQRIARTGARFGSVPDVLALYRMRPDSASVNGLTLLADGLRVIEQGHLPDPRVLKPHPAHANGRPAAELPVKQHLFACWCAGLEIGQRRNSTSLLSSLPNLQTSTIAAADVARNIALSVPTARCEPPSSWTDAWPEVSEEIDRFLGALEARLDAPGLRLEVLRRLADFILQMGWNSRPARIGGSCGLAVDVALSIPDITVGPEIERVHADLSYGDERFGSVLLPVFDGLVPNDVLADAIAAEHAWTLLRLFFQRTLGTVLEVRKEGAAFSVWRGAVCVARDVDSPDVYSAEVHQQAGWFLLLQELWGRPEWTLDRFYDPDLVEDTEVVHVSEPWLRVDVGGTLPDAVVDGPSLHALVQVGGTPIGAVTLPGPRVSAASLRAAITRRAGFELCRSAMREGVIGQPSGVLSLAARLALASARTDAMKELPRGLPIPQDVIPAPGWDAVAARASASPPIALLMARYPHGQIDSAVSRRAALPIQVVLESFDKTPANVGLVLHVPLSTVPARRVSYVPDLIWRPRGSHPSSVARPDENRPLPDRLDHHHDRGAFETLFACQRDPWKYSSAYEQVKYQQTLALLPPGRIDHALEIGCAEGHFTVQLAGRVTSLVAADISRVALERAAERCTGCPNVHFAQLDLRSDHLSGPFDLIVCSELLYYMGSRAKLEDVARRLGQALTPGGYLLHAHAYLVADNADRPGFDWDHPFGAQVIGDVLAAASGLKLVAELRTPLYRIQLFGKSVGPARPHIRELRMQPTALLPEVERHVLWHGGAPRRDGSPDEPRTAALPIVMYHRIASDGPPGLARYRVSPTAFEAQLAFLRDSGYYSVTLDVWREAMAAHTALPGRAILLTFDDGYRDFLSHAWPLLKRYGFSATVFLVADHIGGFSTWDREFGELVPLLDWPDIRRLRDDGVSFGSHTSSHRRLTAVSHDDAVRELMCSRMLLGRELDTLVDAVAYPYGATDPIVQHVAGACGYTLGVTCRTNRSGLWEDPMALPRIEVRGDEGFDEFVRSLAP